MVGCGFARYVGRARTRPVPPLGDAVFDRSARDRRLYFLRAKTEKKHLMNDPEYREYAEWIARNGAIAKLSRVFD